MLTFNKKNRHIGGMLMVSTVLFNLLFLGVSYLFNAMPRIDRL